MFDEVFQNVLSKYNGVIHLAFKWVQEFEVQTYKKVQTESLVSERFLMAPATEACTAAQLQAEWVEAVGSRFFWLL